MTSKDRSSHLVFWGSYDLGKPRARILLEGAKKAGFEVVECHHSVWERFQDKSEIRGAWAKARILLGWLLGIPRQILRYLSLPDHDWVVVGYPGPIEVLLIKPFARLRGARVAWDVFFSAYDTVVLDRKMLPPFHPVGLIIYALEWLAAKFADRVFLDTEAHARSFEKLFHLRPESVGSVWVGAETTDFPPRMAAPPRAPGVRPFEVLFYGQFIPLHGLDTIIEAAAKTEQNAAGPRVNWTIIGTGQVAERIDARISEMKLTCIRRIPWVRYEELVREIHGTDVALGIFGTSQKARSVIPNKAYQILAANTPLISGDTPAMRELLARYPYASNRIHLVPPGNPSALAEEILRLANLVGAATPGLPLPAIGSIEVGSQLKSTLDGTKVSTQQSPPRKGSAVREVESP